MNLNTAENENITFLNYRVEYNYHSYNIRILKARSE